MSDESDIKELLAQLESIKANTIRIKKEYLFMLDALKGIENALFPAPYKNAEGDNISDDAYYNLEGALYDLKRTGADKVCIHTIERVQEKIFQVHKIFQTFKDIKLPDENLH